MFKELRRELQKPISGSRYAAYGLLLFILKYSFDRMILQLTFSHYWGLLDYWRSHFWITLSQQTALGIFLFLLDAMMFLSIGVIMTLRRLRTVGAPPWLALLFFVPLFNLIFFVVLIALPTRNPRPLTMSWSEKHPPTSRVRAIATAILCVAPPALLLVWFTTAKAASYGGGLFLGVPFALGFISVTIYNWHTLRGFNESIGVAVFSVLCVGCGLLVLGWEGLICLFMALIVAAPLAFLGGALGYAIVDMRHTRNAIAGALLLVLPMFAPQERQLLHRAPANFEVHSSIEIAAPPEKVWQHVIAFSEITEKPNSPILRTGIAYPIHATISGRGVGAVRECMFTTGAFEEPIDVWDEPHRLHFSVAKQPPVMSEMSWVPNLQPEHITREYLRSRKGQFLLTQLPNGHTLLEGTTWYDLQYWPSSYWHLWSDAIIHRIHMRVLEHIKAEVEVSFEGDVTSSPQPTPARRARAWPRGPRAGSSAAG